jgi:hypothetical protein
MPKIKIGIEDPEKMGVKPFYIDDVLVYEIDIKKYMGHQRHQVEDLRKAVEEYLKRPVTTEELKTALTMDWISK